MGCGRAELGEADTRAPLSTISLVMHSRCGHGAGLFERADLAGLQRTEDERGADGEDGTRDEDEDEASNNVPEYFAGKDESWRLKDLSSRQYPRQCEATHHRFKL